MILSTLLSQSAGLDILDGYQDIIELNGVKQVVKRPYIFKSAKTSWNIAKIRRVFKAHIQDYTEARDALIKEISDGGVEIKEDDAEKIARFAERHNALLREEVVVEGLLKLKLDDLLNEREEKDKDGVVKKVSNPIPASVLEAIMDLIEE